MCVCGGEGGDVDAGEVEEGVLVIGTVVFVGLVVAGIDAVEGGVDFGLDGVKGIENGFCGVEVFSSVGEGLETEFDFRGCY